MYFLIFCGIFNTSSQGGEIMNIAICDDDNQSSGMLNILLKEYASRKNITDLSVSIYTDGNDLLDAIQEDKCFDICILDILMPTVSGIELGTKLREKAYNGVIIYLTSSKDFALDSYKVKAFNYILKPVIPDELYSTLDDAITTLSTKVDKTVIVKTKEGNVRISSNNILYVELCKRILIYHLDNGSTLESLYLRVPFTEATKDLLANKNFLQCGAGKVINLSQVTMVSNEEIIFKDTYKVYFSKKICNEILSIWNNR